MLLNCSIDAPAGFSLVIAGLDPASFRLKSDRCPDQSGATLEGDAV